jgi:tetratricopeptide (TPR) repeat protein
MKRMVALVLGLLLVIPSVLYLAPIRKATLPQVRLGYKPRFEVLYFTCLDYRLLLSELYFFDTVFYYGSLIEKAEQKPDYRMLVQYVDTATRLNPYNIDSYYFGQAILTWDAGLVKEMNWILQRGVKKRTWDFYIPFFLGFNYSYFLNDYDTAAEYTAQAARLNPNAEYLTTLASRMYYEANKTDQAISYLQVMLAGARNEGLRKSIITRITALESISLLEKAAKTYEAKTGRPLKLLSELVRARVLKAIPPDPYGGEFYLDQRDGRIKTTSKMSSTRSTE